MKLGTPLSPAAVKVMLLGSGELGKEVVLELQRLGVETIAVDRYADAPAHQVAHRSHVIDMTDAKVLRALVEQERPHLLVPEIEALATDELVRIEADGLCTVIPTARAAHITMNRERIRVLAAEELKLPTSLYAFASSLEELQGLGEMGKDAAGNVVVPLTGLSGEDFGAIVISQPSSWSAPERRLVAGFARYLGGALEILEKRHELALEEARRETARQRMRERGVGALWLCQTCGRCYDDSVERCEGDGTRLVQRLLP